MAEAPDVFETVVEEVVSNLDPAWREQMSNLAIMIEAETGDGGPALGQFSGVPLPERRFSHLRARPDEIVLFEGPIRREAARQVSPTPENVQLALRIIIKNVLVHELGHYFGLTHREMGASIDPIVPQTQEPEIDHRESPGVVTVPPSIRARVEARCNKFLRALAKFA